MGHIGRLVVQSVGQVSSWVETLSPNSLLQVLLWKKFTQNKNLTRVLCALINCGGALLTKGGLKSWCLSTVCVVSALDFTSQEVMLFFSYVCSVFLDILAKRKRHAESTWNMTERDKKDVASDLEPDETRHMMCPSNPPTWQDFTNTPAFFLPLSCFY